MRKIFYPVSLFSLSVLWSTLAVAKEAPNHAMVTSRDVPSECDQVVDNLVSNCGFETSAFDFWIRSGDLGDTFVTSNPDQIHSGGFACETGPAGDLGFLKQTLPTTAGQSYTLTFWLKNSERPNHFQLFWDGAVIFDATDMPNFPYTQMVFEDLVASADGTDLQFGFYNLDFYFHLDDVVVH